MADLKLTKNGLKLERQKLTQLERYLPTLQLKKALLQAEVAAARLTKDSLEKEWNEAFHKLSVAGPLFNLDPSFPYEQYMDVEEIHKESENIAGAELPIFKGLSFRECSINRFDTPPWMDSVLAFLQTAKAKKIALDVAKQRASILEKECNEVSIRVNLFEKVLIPRAKENIKKIRVFLGDLLLAAVSQAKVAKLKIVERK